MLVITPTIWIDEDELQFAFIRSTGPGGQNVNKVSTAVQLRFNVNEATSLPQEVKLRLKRLAGKRVSVEGILVIEARQFRSQERNRQAALDRLARLVRQATEPPKKRRRTRPTRASILRRLASKQKRGEIKRLRGDKGIID